MIYTKESLELLKKRIDLVEALNPYLRFQRTGATYKGLCPFHDEKTPSFMIQKGDTHYHCFGCGAHGDAISFFMNYLKMSFTEAVENLAERFQVTLEKIEAENEGKKVTSKSLLKEVLHQACRFYHFYLLYSEEGRQALDYLYARGLTNSFIRQFEIGLAPSHKGMFLKVMREFHFTDTVLEESGLITTHRPAREFFFDRIMFPIRDSVGNAIGFSARKFKENQGGGKYINTSETSLFKKSQVLYGLSYCRRRIARERKAIIVEGQIDALRLIHAGLNFTVAGQGTAFGEGHVKELLNLGVNHVYLALDGDDAGQEAAVKIGDFFQKKGVEVSVVNMGQGRDPDLVLREEGIEGFLQKLENPEEYLVFLVRHFSKKVDVNSPSGKNELVQTISNRIREWEHPVMVHESLKKLAEITDVPEAILGVDLERIRPLTMRKSAKIDVHEVNPDRILETDLLRWLILVGETQPKIMEIAKCNIQETHFRDTQCLKLYTVLMTAYAEGKPRDILSLAMEFPEIEANHLLSQIMQRKVNLQKAEEGMLFTVEKVLQRAWMEEREMIKLKIHTGQCSETEILELAKKFDQIKKAPPKVTLPQEVSS